MKKLMAFPRTDDYQKAKAILDQANLSYDIIKPSDTIKCIDVPALAFEQEVFSFLYENSSHDFINSGFVDYRAPMKDGGESVQDNGSEDILGKAIIMTLMPCIADETKIRLIAHLNHEIAPVFPYLNTQMGNALYVKDAGVLTFMENHRMITLYNNKVAIAKADDITDAWRILEKIRYLVNTTWQKRSSITPSDFMRKKPPALEIYYRLPRINCGACGLQSCMAFALTLWSGNTQPTLCAPIFEGEYAHLKDAFSEICVGLGLTI